jgi:hypothetical protein
VQTTLFSPKPADAGFYTPSLRRPTSAVIEHVRRLLESHEPIAERREAPRLSVTFAARAIALDRAMQPTGNEFVVIVRNISETGLGLLSMMPVDSRYLAVEMATESGELLLVAIEVLRCQAIGPCFDIGGPYVRPASAP